MSNTIYQDAFSIWDTLTKINVALSLQNAITLRFKAGESPVTPLTSAGDALLESLHADQLIRLETIQTQVAEYRNAELQRDEWRQRLAAVNARRRTLEMRARNVEQEQGRGGLFRGKRQQELLLESQNLSDALLRAHNEAGDLEDNLSRIERYRAEISERLRADQTLQDARWVMCGREQGGVVATLTPEGRFLLTYLSEMRPEVLQERPLSQVLVYGVAWSMSL